MSALWNRAVSVVRSGLLTQRQIVAMTMAFSHVQVNTGKHSSFQKSIISKIAHEYHLSDSQKTYLVYLMSYYRGQDTEGLYKHYFEQSSEKVVGRAEIMNKILDNDQCLYDSILKIDNLQTDQEKRASLSLEWNGVGWSAFDVRTMTRLADVLKQTGSLDYDSATIARVRIRRYTGQLEKLANM